MRRMKKKKMRREEMLKKTNKLINRKIMTMTKMKMIPME